MVEGRARRVPGIAPPPGKLLLQVRPEVCWRQREMVAVRLTNPAPRDSPSGYTSVTHQLHICYTSVTSEGRSLESGLVALTTSHMNIKEKKSQAPETRFL